jgi:hypothetical protein
LTSNQGVQTLCWGQPDTVHGGGDIALRCPRRAKSRRNRGSETTASKWAEAKTNLPYPRQRGRAALPQFNPVGQSCRFAQTSPRPNLPVDHAPFKWAPFRRRPSGPPLPSGGNIQRSTFNAERPRAYARASSLEVGTARCDVPDGQRSAGPTPHPRSSETPALRATGTAQKWSRSDTGD